MSVDQYYAERPDAERAIFEAVRGHLASLGPVIVEPVNVGVLFKRRRTFAELRPMKRWLSLSFGLNRRVDHPRIARTTRTNTAKTYHGVNLTGPGDVDQQVLDWLTESYLDFSG